MGCGGSKPDEGSTSAADGGSPGSPNVPAAQKQKSDLDLKTDAEKAKKISDPAQESSRRRGAPSKAAALLKDGGVALQLDAVKPSVIDEGGDDNDEDEEYDGEAAAIELVRETLTANRAALGGKHASTLTSVNNLATLLQDAGQLEEAEKLFVEALETRREVLGPADPATLTSINNLGMLLLEKGSVAEAEKLLREALGARRLSLGVDHTDTQDSLYNLGRLLQDKGGAGALAEAAGLLREELEAAAKAKGKEEDEVVESAIHLRGLLLEAGMRDDALALTAEYALPAAKESDVVSKRLLEATQNKVSKGSLQAARDELGSTHADTLVLMNDLASLLHEEHDLSAAEALFREALGARRATLGDRDPATLTSANNLGLLLRDKGDQASLDEATTLLREALGARREVLGASHPETADSLFNLGSLLQECGVIEEACALLAEELKLSAERSGKDSSDVLDSASNLNGLYIKAGKSMDAARLRDEYGLGPNGEPPQPDDAGGDEKRGGASETKMAFGRDQFNS